MVDYSARALAAARKESEKSGVFDAGLCLRHVRLWYGIAAKYPSAIEAWEGAGGADGDATHTVLDPPKGVPVFWSGGRFGHIALSAGNGKIWTTDLPQRGRTGLVDIELVHERWNYKYLGWAETLNGVRVYRDVN